MLSANKGFHIYSILRVQIKDNGRNSNRRYLNYIHIESKIESLSIVMDKGHDRIT